MGSEVHRFKIRYLLPSEKNRAWRNQASDWDHGALRGT